MAMFRGMVNEMGGAIKNSNYWFYMNQHPSSPSGGLIDEIHRKWLGDYHLLESHHGYIQWLFPLFEGGGRNFQSEPLSKEEAYLMRNDIDIAKRIIKSYKMMQSLGHVGFTRYKRPFLEFMKKEIMENKQIPNAKESLLKYWLPLLDVDSPLYVRRTFETKEDREDSVIFSLAEVPEDIIQYNNKYIAKPTEEVKQKKSLFNLKWFGKL